jgi:anthranilate phosphoribosyltransferase
MKSENSRKVNINRFTSVLSKEDVKLLYSNEPIAAKYKVTKELGPLEQTFNIFIENEHKLNPLSYEELVALFDACSNGSNRADELLVTLHKLSPGNGSVGFRQVNYLVDRLRNRVLQFLQKGGYKFELIPHDHAFGSGGDFCKTSHATTHASIVAAPLLRICKTGTINVTSEHGSHQAIWEIGYNEPILNLNRLNNQLTNYGFSFIPLSSLGFPYSDALKIARKRLWNEAFNLLKVEFSSGETSWQNIVRATDIPLDIFKIVSPNSQVLNPVNHCTGVCHLKMMPYVLAIYLHLGSTGVIAHCYDGIDEVSNASSDPTKSVPNNLVVKVESDRIIITEFSPEDLGFIRADIQDIEEEKSVKNDAKTFWQILSGDIRNPKRDFVVANAALLLVAGNKVSNTKDDIVTQLSAGVTIAEYLLDSKLSYKNFKQLLDF